MQDPLPEWDDNAFRSAIESILLVAGGSVSVAAMASALCIPSARVVRILERLRDERAGGFRVQLHEGSAQLVTAPENVEVIHRFLGTPKPPSFTKSALET